MKQAFEASCPCLPDTMFPELVAEGFRTFVLKVPEWPLSQAYVGVNNVRGIRAPGIRAAGIRYCRSGT